MSGNPQQAAAGTVRHTTCCVVGAGPAGAMLALLLARQNIPVVLLESHADFDRDFRGDSIHPAIMEVLDQLSLADALLELPHRKIRAVSLPTDPPLSLSFEDLPGRFGFMTLMAQHRFLEFLTDQAARYPTFTLITGATVRELIEDSGLVQGVRYHDGHHLHEVQAVLTVGADGRSSTVRRASGLPAVTYGSAIDVLWLRLPRQDADPEGIIEGFSDGPPPTSWQHLSPPGRSPPGIWPRYNVAATGPPGSPSSRSAAPSTACSPRSPAAAPDHPHRCGSRSESRSCAAKPSGSPPSGYAPNAWPARRPADTAGELLVWGEHDLEGIQHVLPRLLAGAALADRSGPATSRSRWPHARTVHRTVREQRRRSRSGASGGYAEIWAS